MIRPSTTRDMIRNKRSRRQLMMISTVLYLSRLTKIRINSLLMRVRRITMTLASLVSAWTLCQLKRIRRSNRAHIIRTRTLIATLLNNAQNSISKRRITRNEVSPLRMVIAILLKSIPPLLHTHLRYLYIFRLL